MVTEFERGGDEHLQLRPDGEGWEFATNARDEKKGLRWAICQEEFMGYEFKVTSPAYNTAGEIQEGVAIWARKDANFRTEEESYIVDTAYASDTEAWRTAISTDNGGSYTPVEQYESREAAEKGHQKWIKSMEEEYWTVYKAAKLLSRHPKTIQRWFDAGILKGFRHPVNNYRMIPLSEVNRILDQCKVGG